MIRSSCPYCDATQSAPDDAGGKKATCAKCGNTFVLPRVATLSGEGPAGALQYRGRGLTPGAPTIRCTCPGCRSIYELSDCLAGKKFACRTCRRRLQVPAPRRADDAPAPPQRPWLWPGVIGGSTLIVLVGGLLILLVSHRHRLAAARAESSPSAPATTDASSALAQKARDVFQANCARCHGDGSPAEGGFNYVLDRDKLVATKKVIPGDSENSKIYRKVSRGQMPPPDEGGPLPADSVAVLKQWIDAGAPAVADSAGRAGFVADAQLVTLMRDDLLSLPERDRRYTRYFTLTNLANGGASADDLQTDRFAVSKLVNSLSWNRAVVAPRSVDPAGTVLRIDVRNYSWNEYTWRRLLAAYPFGVRPQSAAARTLFDAVGGDLPYVRGDWFVANASRPPLYHDLLGLPNSESDLEKLLHIDIPEDVRQERVARAGFNGSGVSRNNRLIERHPSPYGSYWRSYDFGDTRGTRNLFAHPLGPGPDANACTPDGGEIIFNLPNGLHAFMLVNGQGRRLDKAPLTIVSDPRRPDRAVENGVSCLSCHAGGLIAKDDQVRADVQRNPNAFAADEADVIRALYPETATLQSLFAKDNERYRKALEKTGGQASATDPVTVLVAQYEKELDLPAAAAELGLRPAELSARLDQSAVLARTLGPLKVPGGTVQRLTFDDAFADVIRELRLGTYLPPGNVKP